MKNATPKTKRFRGRPTIEASREQAIEKQYAAGLKNLWRPDQDGDPYQTKEAVHAWAVRQVDEFIARGVLVIRDPEARTTHEYNDEGYCTTHGVIAGGCIDGTEARK